MAKKYKHVWTTDRDNPQASYRKDFMSSNETQFPTSLKFFVYSEPKSTNKARNQKKNPKLNPFVIEADLETNCKSFRKKQQEKISI